MNSKIKILIGILVIGAVLIGGWWILSKEMGERIEIKGKLEIAESPSPLFNKECMNNDLRVQSYYLTGVCKSSYSAAGLARMVEEEIEVKGRAKEIEADVPSEDDPEVLVTKTFKVIEIEEVIPPEIIMIATDITHYKPGEKITIYLKHYLKKNVFSYFGTEKSICAINSIEKKDGDWAKLSWTQAPDCPQITLKEIKPYHLSGEFGMFGWQPTLDPGQYRLEVIYKLSGEEEWKTVYSNEFIISRPEIPAIETKCKVGMGHDREAEEKFQKVIIADIEFNNYKNFSLKEMLIQYGYGPNLFEEGTPIDLTLKIKSEDQGILKTYKIYDSRAIIISCPQCPPGEYCPCPPPEFLKDGEYTLIISYHEDARFIELYDKTEPDPIFPDYKPTGELLLVIDLAECMLKFCDEVALENDPYCVGEYYSASTIIKGKITDHQGNPVEDVRIEVQWAPTGEPLTWKSTIVDTLYTDKDGNYILERFLERLPDESRLKEGTYSFSIYPPFRLNLKQEYREIALKKGETKTVNIALKQCGSISGKVTDAQGNPLTYGNVYEIGFETPRYAICDETRAKEGECELGTFIIPYLEPGDYRIGAEVKIGEEYIEIPSKNIKVELGRTTVVDFMLER